MRINIIYRECVIQRLILSLTYRRQLYLQCQIINNNNDDNNIIVIMIMIMTWNLFQDLSISWRCLTSCRAAKLLQSADINYTSMSNTSQIAAHHRLKISLYYMYSKSVEATKNNVFATSIDITPRVWFSLDFIPSCVCDSRSRGTFIKAS